jgi:hypothetical protein
MPELDGWEAKAREYFEDLYVGPELLNAAPQTDEERHEIFLQKRRTVLALVDKIFIEKDRSLRIVFKLNVLEIIRQLSDFYSIQQA